MKRLITKVIKTLAKVIGWCGFAVLRRPLVRYESTSVGRDELFTSMRTSKSDRNGV